MLLEHVASPDIPALQQTCSGLLLVPLGATEQHGPHLPVGMDSLLADSLCQTVSDATSVPMLRTLRITASQAHTTKWPGTFSLTHEGFINSLVDIADWSARGGWSRLLFINTHFGNDAPTRVAVDKIRLTHMGSLQVGLINAFQMSPEIQHAYTKDAADLHANQAETALMMHLYPDLVHFDRLTSANDPDRTTDTVFSYPVSQTSSNGVTGYPSRANAQQGEKLFDQMVIALSKLVKKSQTERPPL